MAKFNSQITNKTENLAGATAYKESAKLELISLLLTSFAQDEYYEKTGSMIDRIKRLIPCANPEFAAKAAVFARNEFGMRSITHITAAEIAQIVKGESWTKRFFDKVIKRPDDITEIISYFLNTYGKPLPNSLKKGLRKAIGKFDPYQLAKYRSEGKDVTLVDVINLLHPVATERNGNALTDIIKGTLKSDGTWETNLTQAGQDAKTEDEKKDLKNEAWSSLLKERKIGYFALLRNLRNIMQQAPEEIDTACDLLIDKNLISKSLVLPFRYVSAIQAIKESGGNQKIYQALNKAIDISSSNVPKFDGKTLVVADFSGSMGDGLTSRRGIGSLFGTIMAKANNADLMIFGSFAEYVPINTDDTTLTIVEYLDTLNNDYPGGRGLHNVGHGTSFGSIFTTANKKYDRIFIFSDMQGWKSGGAPTRVFNSYKKKFDANPFVYSIDLAGYGTLMFPENNVFALSGFSEKLFDIMKVMEQDRKSLIKKIENIEL